jgi:hypothetical protein
MENTNLEWKNPPKPVRYKRGNVKWQAIAEELRKRPNEWALIAHDVNPSLVTHIRQGRLQAFTPNGTFEASGQGRNERGYTTELYARFVGEETSGASATVSASATPKFIEQDEASETSLSRRAEEARTRFESLAAETESSTPDLEFMPAEYADDPEL